MSEVRTPEGVTIAVTGRPPELFLRIVTPSGLEFGWPVQRGSIGYKVAEEIAALAQPREVVKLADRRSRRGGTRLGQPVD